MTSSVAYKNSRTWARLTELLVEREVQQDLKTKRFIMAELTYIRVGDYYIPNLVIDTGLPKTRVDSPVLGGTPTSTASEYRKRYSDAVLAYVIGTF